MSEQKNRNIIPYRGGFFQELVARLKLILRLLADNRVNPLLKLIPVGSLVYLVFPDLAPGPLDDAAIIWLGLYLFVELCPPDVVQEHMAALTNVIPGELREVPPAPAGEQIIEAEFQDEEQETPPSNEKS